MNLGLYFTFPLAMVGSVVVANSPCVSCPQGEPLPRQHSVVKKYQSFVQGEKEGLLPRFPHSWMELEGAEGQTRLEKVGLHCLFLQVES